MLLPRKLIFVFLLFSLHYLHLPFPFSSPLELSVFYIVRVRWTFASLDMFFIFYQRWFFSSTPMHSWFCQFWLGICLGPSSKIFPSFWCWFSSSQGKDDNGWVFVEKLRWRIWFLWAVVGFPSKPLKLRDRIIILFQKMSLRSILRRMDG